MDSHGGPWEPENRRKKKMHTENWKRDWNICMEDLELSQKIIPVFESYLQILQGKGASKSTFNRHKSACHALGGYIIEQVFNYEENPFSGNESGEEILLHYIDNYGGPLIHHDNEIWQNEVDAACRKLYKVLSGKTTTVLGSDRVK